MKPIFYTILSLCICINSYAQKNMVPNGNFEDYTACPTGPSQIANCTGWFEYSPSSDFFNTCSNTASASVPNNFVGMQNAASGNGYGGLLTNALSGARESIGSHISALTIGRDYEVSISVSLAEMSRYAMNCLGVLFYINGPSAVNSLAVINTIPQISYKQLGPISDKTNWIRLSQTFTADSAYNHMAIAGFGQASSYTIDTLPVIGGLSFAYYYIDSVVVRIIPRIIINYTDTSLCTGDTTYVPYTLSPNIFSSSNTFTVQLSNATGSFANPTNIGSIISNTSGSIRCIIPLNTPSGAGYKIRIKSNSPIDTSYESKAIRIGAVKGLVAASNTPICSGQQINLSTNITPHSAITWNWAGPNGFTSLVQNPVINNANPINSGDYIVSANMYGCIAKDTVSITVLPSPVSSGLIGTGNSPVCANDTLKLSSSNAAPGTVYNWTGPNGFNSGLQNPTIFAGNVSSGDYIISCTLNGCTLKDTVPVLIKPTPANFSAVGPTPICIAPGGTFNMNAASTSAGVNYTWMGPNGFTANIPNPSLTGINAAQAGNYIVTATLNGCSIKDSLTLKINMVSAAPIISGNSLVCIGSTLNLSASSTAGASYSWAGPNGFTSAMQNPIRTNVTTADAGIYSVFATLNGCISPTASTNAIVNPRPFINIYPTPGDSICTRSAVIFTAITANTGTGVTYKWTKNSNTSILSTANSYTTATVNNNDIIRCEMTDPSKCGSAFSDTSNEIKMTVLPWLAPSVSILLNPTTPLAPYQLVTFTATPVNGGNNPKYQWQRNSSDVIGATSNVWGTQQLSDNDNIRVILTSSYKCPQPVKDTSNTIRVAVLTGVNNVDGANNLQLYPNPNNGSFNLKGSLANANDITIQITNALGQLVYESVRQLRSKEINEEVNVQHLAGGIYTLRLTNLQTLQTFKFKIER